MRKKKSERCRKAPDERRSTADTACALMAGMHPVRVIMHENTGYTLSKEDYRKADEADRPNHQLLIPHVIRGNAKATKSNRRARERETETERQMKYKETVRQSTKTVRQRSNNPHSRLSGFHFLMYHATRTAVVVSIKTSFPPISTQKYIWRERSPLLAMFFVFCCLSPALSPHIFQYG